MIVISMPDNQLLLLILLLSALVHFLFSREGLGEGYDGDIAYASALETFGGGHNDPISVAFGGMCPCN